MPNNKSHKNANGAGSLRKRKNGLWEARYTAIVNGRPAQKSIYGKTQTEVRKKLAAITVELDEGSYLEPTKYTLESWCKEWLEIYVKPSVKRSTYDKYENDMRVCILPKLGMIKLTDLVPGKYTVFETNAAGLITNYTLDVEESTTFGNNIVTTGTPSAT